MNKKKRHGHIVVMGTITYSVLKTVVRDLFSTVWYPRNYPDWNFYKGYYRQSKIVVLCSEEPSLELKQLLQSPLYKRRVKWLQGSEMVNEISFEFSQKNSIKTFFIILLEFFQEFFSNKFNYFLYNL